MCILVLYYTGFSRGGRPLSPRLQDLSCSRNQIQKIVSLYGPLLSHSESYYLTHVCNAYGECNVFSFCPSFCSQGGYAIDNRIAFLFIVDLHVDSILKAVLIKILTKLKMRIDQLLFYYLLWHVCDGCPFRIVEGGAVFVVLLANVTWNKSAESAILYKNLWI